MRKGYTISRPTILVIIGVTGDLSRRKLLPAIEQIVKAGASPKDLRVVGITRQDSSAAMVLSDTSHNYLRNNLQMFQMDLAKASHYTALNNYLNSIEKELGKPVQRLFYLSIPPQFSRPVVELLGKAGFGKNSDTKLLLEKPFGVDLISAQELIAETKAYFTEDQIYRIDHYLAKEMAQNMIVFRQSNALFKRTWNNNFIERIEIIASERIDIQGRAAFYEQTGALRDLVQSHLLQLAALTLMKLSDNIQQDIPSLRRDALRQLHVARGTTPKRGQYEGYRDQVNNQRSMTETYVDITFTSHDPLWKDVPIRIVTGKALASKYTQIKVVYKKEAAHEANELVISLQPNEGVSLQLWTKVPGYDRALEKHSLAIAFKDHFPALPEAYEQVLVDAIQANHTLFASSDEVLETWRIVDPIMKAWEMSADDLSFYAPGLLDPGQMHE